LDDFSELAKDIEKEKKEFHFKSTKDTMTIVDDFGIEQIVRSQMICLFSYMETIFCLLTVYDFELTDERKIMEISNNNINKYIDKCILTKDNEFYNKNIDRLKKITAGNFKILRNSLTHFYSVSENI
jgi:predicted nucleotidyltransferase component of viral defense system